MGEIFNNMLNNNDNMFTNNILLSFLLFFWKFSFLGGQSRDGRGGQSRDGRGSKPWIINSLH